MLSVDELISLLYFRLLKVSVCKDIEIDDG